MHYMFQVSFRHRFRHNSRGDVGGEFRRGKPGITTRLGVLYDYESTYWKVWCTGITGLP